MVLPNFLQQLRQLGLQVLQIRFVGNIHIADRTRVVIRPVQDVLHLGIVDDLHIVAAVHHAGGPDADFLDGPPKAADFDNISHVALVLKEHEQARDHVGDQALCTEAHDQGQNAHTGHDGRHVHPQNGQAPAQDGQGSSILNETVHQGAQRLSPMGLGLKKA